MRRSRLCAFSIGRTLVRSLSLLLLLVRLHHLLLSPGRSILAAIATSSTDKPMVDPRSDRRLLIVTTDILQGSTLLTSLYPEAFETP